MKTKKNERQKPPKPTLSKAHKPRKISVEINPEEAQAAMDNLLAVGNPKPVGGRMVLKNEIGQKWTNPSWLEVVDAIDELDPGHANSFVCLSVRGKTYVQCLRGFNGWHLEWRITEPSGEYTHYRACRPEGSKKPFELKKHDFVSAGQHRDLLDFVEVLHAFRAFHQGLGLPRSLKWRKLDI